MCVSVGSGCINISNRTVISSVPAAHSKHRHTHTHSQSKAWRQTHTHTRLCTHTLANKHKQTQWYTHRQSVCCAFWQCFVCQRDLEVKITFQKKKKNCRKTHTHTNSSKHCVEVRDGEQEWQTRGVKFQTLCVCVCLSILYPHYMGLHRHKQSQSEQRSQCCRLSTGQQWNDTLVPAQIMVCVCGDWHWIWFLVLLASGSRGRLLAHLNRSPRSRWKLLG